MGFVPANYFSTSFCMLSVLGALTPFHSWPRPDVWTMASAVKVWFRACTAQCVTRQCWMKLLTLLHVWPDDEKYDENGAQGQICCYWGQLCDFRKMTLSLYSRINSSTWLNGYFTKGKKAFYRNQIIRKLDMIMPWNMENSWPVYPLLIWSNQIKQKAPIMFRDPPTYCHKELWVFRMLKINLMWHKWGWSIVPESVSFPVTVLRTSELVARLPKVFSKGWSMLKVCLSKSAINSLQELCAECALVDLTDTNRMFPPFIELLLFPKVWK